MRLRSVLTTLALAGASPAAAAVLDLIDQSRLPQDPTVLKAWSDVAAQEPWAGAWAPEWNHPVPKAQVAASLGAALAALRKADGAKAPRELLLAIGLTARLAHNLDVEGAPEQGLEALTRAAQGGPKDLRPRWFLGTNLCLMGNPDGITRLEEARAGIAGPLVPPAYWRDVLWCAASQGLPVRGSEAGQRLAEAGALAAEDDRVVGQLRSLLKEPAHTGEIPVADAWTGLPGKGGTRLASRVCGFAVPATDEWSAAPVKDATCLANGPIGSFPGKTGKVLPSVVAMARAAREGETLEAFIGSFGFLAGRQPTSGYPCPASACRTFALRNPDSYAPEGGGFAIAVAFERAEPAVRGLALESPTGPPKSPGGEVKYYQVLPRYVRLPGKVYYLIVLDSAQSVAEPAKSAYRRLLQDFLVE